jgi:dimethylhistidine N-methyltransferase
MLADVILGLSATPKHLSPKYLYDAEGSRLFERICELPEYYVTRTEVGILRAHGDELADVIAPSGGVRIVEPGAGAALKTRLHLEALGPARVRSYVPVDIDESAARRGAAALASELPWLRVRPLGGDFTTALARLAEPSPESRRVLDTDVEGREPSTVVYFPGSTIGNFEPADARALLASFRDVAGPTGSVVLGVDLKKDPAILHAAYNDREGVTAAFDKNLLVRMNRELGADFDLASFAHYAFYDPRQGRIEMHLVSTRPQTVHVATRAFDFEDGESLHTECSYKWELEAFQRLAESAGLETRAAFLDPKRWFAVLALQPTRGS